MIGFVEQDRRIKSIGRKDLKKWLTSVVVAEGKEVGEICIVFCSDEYLVEVNKKFLTRDYFTDVITFDYCEGNVVSGDILISVDRVKENAKELSIPFLIELRRIMVHGVLHLIGYEDSSDKKKGVMTQMEEFYLGRIQEEHE